MNIFLGNPPENIRQWIINDYNRKQEEKRKIPLCFEAVGADMTVKYGNDFGYAGGMQEAGINFQYSTDGKNWTEWALGETQFDPISIPVGTKLYLRGNNPNGVYSPNGPTGERFRFTGSGTINASGNIQSLIDPTMERTDVPENCYKGMFSGCTNLTQAPVLPATTLANGCYYNMFYGCTSLTQAPVLPAITLVDSCYYNMFYGCTSLTQAPALPATALAKSCYSGMFGSCSALTQAPELPVTTLADNCYSSMFQECTSLTQAPALPATTLANRCYSNMFKSCSKFSECHMKVEMNGVYNTSTHGDTTKTVIYDL